jgi:hypothetical protein
VTTKTLFHASLETRHFSFDAYAFDHAAAWGALVQSLKRHGKQCSLPDNWFGGMLDDSNVTEFKFGKGYRDRYEI